MDWQRATALVAFWAILGGALDVLLTRKMGFATGFLAVRYAAASGLLWAGLCLPFCLALAGVAARVARRRNDARWESAGLVAAQLGAILLPWTLVLLLSVHKQLPKWIPVASAQGIALTCAIGLAALALGFALTRLAGRFVATNFLALAAAGWLLTLGALGLVVFGGVSSSRKPTDRPNLLLISIDSLRRDVFDEYLAEHASPTFRRFVSGSRRYTNAHTTYTHSLPSHASMFTGLYPPKHGALILREHGIGLGSPLSHGVRTLAEVLGNGGYETMAVLSNAWIGPPFGLEAGFDTYANSGIVKRVGFFDTRLAINASMVGPYVRYLDARLLRTVHPNARIFLRWLRAREPSEPFFAFLHFIEMHTPNDPPESYRADFVHGRLAHLSGTDVLYKMEDGEFREDEMPEVRSHLRDLHLAALARMDDFVQPVLDELMRGGWLENTLVFVVSDHGENLYEKGGTYGKSHVYHTSSEVPFLLRVPGEGEGSERSDLVSLVDIAPTLYGFAGLPAPVVGDGLDLLAGAARGSGDWLYVQGWDVPNGDHARALLFGDGYKLLRDGARREELYDLRSDPHEDLSLTGDRSDGYRERLDQILDELGDTTNAPLAVDEIPEGVREQLKAMGYLQ